MQGLLDTPRAAFTAGQILALLQGPSMRVDYGVERLDDALVFQEDISSDVSSVVVSRDNKAAVHGTVLMTVDRDMAWGYDRIRPFMLLSDGGAVPAARFNLGVYLLTSPQLPLGIKGVKRGLSRIQQAQTKGRAQLKVTGFDQMHLLQNPLGDSYTVASGTNVIGAITAATSSAGILAPVLLDQSSNTLTLPTTKTWPLTSSSSPTWGDVVGDLLAAIGYGPMWCDWNGAFRAGPFVPANARPVEYTFQVGDLNIGVVQENRAVDNDVWGAPNQWVFIQNGLTAAPVEGTSQYTVNNASTGYSSQVSVSRIVRAAPVFFDAVDFPSLQTQGDAAVAAATASTETIAVSLSPFPIAWHLDIATYSDPELGADRIVQGASWQLPCDGTPMTMKLETVM